MIVSSGIGPKPRPRTPEPLWAHALEREVSALEAAGREVTVMNPREAWRTAA